MFHTKFLNFGRYGWGGGSLWVLKHPSPDYILAIVYKIQLRPMATQLHAKLALTKHKTDNFMLYSLPGAALQVEILVPIDAHSQRS